MIFHSGGVFSPFVGGTHFLCMLMLVIHLAGPPKTRIIIVEKSLESLLMHEQFCAEMVSHTSLHFIHPKPSRMSLPERFVWYRCVFLVLCVWVVMSLPHIHFPQRRRNSLWNGLNNTSYYRECGALTFFAFHSHTKNKIPPRDSRLIWASVWMRVYAVMLYVSVRECAVQAAHMRVNPLLGALFWFTYTHSHVLARTLPTEEKKLDHFPATVFARQCRCRTTCCWQLLVAW